MTRPIGKNMFQGAFILSVAALITKILSAGYRIPYQNIAGDIGFYIYQQIYPFLGFGLALATYGFPVILSKMIAEETDQDRMKEKVSVAIFSIMLFSISLFMITFFGAGQIAAFMGDTELKLPIKVTAFTYLFLPFISVYRGYFQGQANMVPTAVSQVLEQLVRVTVIVLGTYLFLRYGFDLYVSGAVAAFGSVLGGLFSSLILWWYWSKGEHAQEVKRKGSSASITKDLFIYGFAISSANLYLILVQFIDAITVYKILLKIGFSEDMAKISKGIFDRGYPLIQLGTILVTSLSLSVVPYISSYRASKDLTIVKEKVLLAAKVSYMIGFGATVGLILISKFVNVMLFTNDRGTIDLSFLALSILFSAVVMITAATLQGLGIVFKPAFYVLCGLMLKVILNPLLISLFQTKGAAIATVFAFLLTASLNMWTLEKVLKIKVIDGATVKSIAIAATVMAFVLIIYQTGLQVLWLEADDSRMKAMVLAISSVVLGVFAYFYTIIKTRLFTKQELADLIVIKKGGHKA